MLPIAGVTMSDMPELQAYMALVDKLIKIADKEDLAECARLLAGDERGSLRV